MRQYDLDAITLRNVGEEVDEEQRAELGPALRGYYNEAYYDLVVNSMKAQRYEQVSLQQGVLSTDGLEKTLVQLLGVYDKPDYEGGSAYTYVQRGRSSFLVLGKAPEQVWIKYRYAPDFMDTGNDDAEPTELPEAYHTLLCTYAAAQHYITQRKYASAEQWLQQYYRRAATLQPQLDNWQMSARNKYPARPGV